MLQTVKVPSQFEAIFQQAQECVARYFKGIRLDPTQGTIEIAGERYILVRAASLSVDFFETLAAIYGKEGKEEAESIARQILFDIAHVIGKKDARNFHMKMGLEEPIEKLSAGPVHFAHTGWAFVDIHPESSPSPDENFYLLYDHPHSFESAAWRAAGKQAEFPVCIMNAGYSSGWCEESFGVDLVATEILCVAKGDPVCRFIMAPPSRIEGRISAYLKSKAQTTAKYEVPGFFKRKKTDEEIRQLNAELEQRVAERTAQLLDAQEALLRKEKLAVLGRVAGSVGHELRNPLGVMNNAVYFLKTVLSETDETVKEYLDMIESEIGNADRIVSDLLDSVRTKPPFPQPVGVEDVIRQTLQKCAIPEVVAVRLAIPEGLSPVRVDPMQMQQVFRNLITNAVDAMPQGGVLEILVEEDADTLNIRFKDTGLGIAPENLDNLFQPMFTTKARGIGLGLMVVKNLTQANGGKVEAESEPGKGTVFSVTLPRGGATG